MYNKLFKAAIEFEKLASPNDGLLSRITRGIAENSLSSMGIGQKALAILNEGLKAEPYPSGDFMKNKTPLMITNATKVNNKWIVNVATTGLKLDTLGSLLNDKVIGKQLTRLMIAFNQTLPPLIEAKLNAMGKSFEDSSSFTDHASYIDNREHFSI